ncbi:ABC transporter permease [Rhodopila sp.]|jgi:lipopolysaccharide transport system permease protein|uniref:ABC transporter permease n=1 Tax=Rhodopila sp. TaxID=2480087 RepID=UPI002CCF0364|nr:ABC transporter permease [Rhodopila sp.]HVZ07522.1 ABC transporter permease [Rhodopila sp.]
MTIAATATPPDIPRVQADAALDLTAEMTLRSRNRHAVDDIRKGLALWRLALTLGWLDVRLRYRGSALGPFWLTISTGVMVGALGVLYSKLFKMDLESYLPFLALSQVLWGFLAALVSEACTTFTEAETVIRSVRMPLFVFSIRTLIRNLITLAHNIVVIVLVFAYFLIWPGADALLALPGLAVWVIDALALTLLLGAFCARFRDIQPIVNSIMQIAFFVSPVIWKPEQLGAGAAKLFLNPFYCLLEIVRAPLLGQPIALRVWAATIVYSLVLCVISWAFFVRARSRVSFWI